MKRRSMLSMLLAGSASIALQSGRSSSSKPNRRSVFILLELRGGNDGLNTIAPISDPLYSQARPSIHLHPEEALPLKAGLALHPALSPLLPLWQKQRLTFALGVGWNNPNRSHFKASDQWATASPSGDGPGWLSTVLDKKTDLGPLLALGPAGCRAMEGGYALALQLSPADLRGRHDRNLFTAQAKGNAALRQMLELEQASYKHLQQIRREMAPIPSQLVLPKSSLGKQVGLALQLIGGNYCPPILQLAQGGYDTHFRQVVRHTKCLEELAEALNAFAFGLDQLTNRPEVTLLVVSEFGRRLRENGSGGTDHGSASIAILFGEHLPDEFIGNHPSLSQLDERGDLIPGISPPDLYRKALELAKI